MKTYLHLLLRVSLWAVAILIALPLTATSAAAQQGTSTIIVTVRTAATNEPLRGAQVLIENTAMGGVTDAAGTLRLEGVPIGAWRVTVRYLGYAPETQAVELVELRPAVAGFALSLQSIPMAEVRVRASAGVRRLAGAGFYHRKQHNPGAFVVRSDIEKRNPQRLSDMLRTIPGVHLASTRVGDDQRASMLRSVPNRRCPIQYFVDGVSAMGFNIDDVAPGSIEALEIYRGASEIPPDFNRGTALCGVIVIWTRIDRG